MMHTDAAHSVHPNSSGRLLDISRILFPNGAVIGAIHLSDVAAAGQVVLVALSIAYTVWRWRRDARK